MAGFLKRLFGGKDKHSVDVAGRTKRISRLAVTGKHVQTLQSLRTSKPRGSEEPDTDTGPWYLGKIVADIFQIRGVLGRGGMGIVYLAHDNATQRKVAVKVPLGKFVSDEDAKKRFTREAEAWTGLIHPNIIHAFDVRDNQSTDYRPAIFMDYCDGGSLSNRICNGQRPSMTEALDIAIQVCWAMEFAHQKGHIHRDLKPANVLLTSDGKALVTDFGLVKILDAEDLDLEAGKLSRTDAQVLASMSEVGGTPEYMSPEQWEGKAEKASDIYAFGVMLYEMFCGCRPFTGQSLIALRTAHMQVPVPDPQQLNRDIPTALAEIMLSCLAKEPCDRPRDFYDLADKLLEIYTVVAKRENIMSKYARTKPQERDINRADKEARAWALTRLGCGCTLRGDSKKAMNLFKQVEQIFRELGNRSGLSSSLGNQAVILKGWGRLEESMDLHKQEEQIFRDLGDREGLSTSLGNQALILKAWGRLEEAINLHKLQEEIRRDLGDRAGLSSSLGNQALILHAWGRLEEAMDLLKQEEQICRDLGDREGLSTSLGNQAVILKNWGRLEEAMDLFKQQEQICRDLGDRYGLSRSLDNQALILKDWGQLDEAMDLLKQEEQICRDLGNRAGLSGSLCNQALILHDWGRPEEAMDLFKQEEQICRDLGDRSGLSTSLGNQALILKDWGRLEEAMDLLKQVEQICRDLGNRAGLSECLDRQALILQAWDRLEKACDQLEEALDPLKQKQEEQICRELRDPYETAISLAHQGLLLANILGQLKEGLKLVEEALDLAKGSGLADLAGRIEGLRSQILEKLSER